MLQDKDIYFVSTQSHIVIGQYLSESKGFNIQSFTVINSQLQPYIAVFSHLQTF